MRRCSAQFFGQQEWPRLLQIRAQHRERSACFRVKCHKECERSRLNYKREVDNAPHGADYLQNSPRSIRTVISHSDSIHTAEIIHIFT